MSHTPGPWKYSYEAIDPEWAIVTAQGGLVVANVNDNQTANARLIAAAPDMLAALKWIADQYESVDLNHVDFRVEAKHRADAVIAKATGK